MTPAATTMVASCPVPPMRDPLGRYWEQPDPTLFLFDEKFVLMTREQFRALREYSTSIPTGTYDGKMWKAEVRESDGPYRMRGTGTWLLRWYAPGKQPDYCEIAQRRIVIGRRKAEA